MGERFWPGQDPIGKRFGQGADKSQWWEVVGVVGDIRSFGLAGRPPYEFYRSIDQQVANSQTVVLFTGTAIAVVLAAMLASYLPALSAGKTDPMIVLRDS